MRDLKYMTVVAVAAVGLALAGCGSDGGPSQADLDAAVAAEQARTAAEAARRMELQEEINALRTQLGLAEDDDLSDSIQELEDQVDDLTQQVADAAKAEADRIAAEEAAEAARMAAAMAATAAKLYAGINAPTATDTDTADTPTTIGTRFARHALEADTDADVGQIRVSIGDADVALSEDEDANIADNHGWTAKRYTRTRPPAEGTYEAVVFSNVEDPTMGRKFGNAVPGTGENREFEYALTNGMFTIDASTTAAHATRVGGSGFDHSAGVKTFKLPSPNPSGVTVVMVTGTFHGVSGTYSCTPGAGNTCAAQVATRGFTLGLVPDGSPFAASDTAWTFRPSDPNARVTSGRDMSYASYGWWIHMAANNGDWTASAFVDELGTDSPDAQGLNDLNGTATYQGGAAGKYALASSTGGTNDAGHFTARATLNANFTENTGANAITGTIDQFIGADGESRDWSVKLDGSTIGDTGVIGEATDGTTWTIGGEAAAASGNWTGSLRNNGDDGVPQVATGTFYSTYGTAGRMVGAFGANKQ